MELPVSFVAVLGAILIGAISPGPSFVFVARTSIAVSRADGVAASIGMGIGGLIFAAASLLGVHIVLTAVPALYASLKLVGAAYLLYLAIRLWAGADIPMGIELGRSGRTGRLLKSFRLGLLTQLSNPKAAIVYASIFTALLPTQQIQWSAVLLLFSIFAIEAGWYVIVAVAFSSERPRRCYLRSKQWIDRGASAVMALLAIRLILDVPLQDRR